MLLEAEKTSVEPGPASLRLKNRQWQNKIKLGLCRLRKAAEAKSRLMENYLLDTWWTDCHSGDCGFPDTPTAQKGKRNKSSDLRLRYFTAGKPIAACPNQSGTTEGPVVTEQNAPDIEAAFAEHP